MLQIKNMLGGGKPEGMYAWKKYSYSPAVSLENPTFDYISATVSSSSSDYTFGNFSFDISIIDDWTKFFTGFVNTNGYGSNFPSDGVFHNYSDNANWNYTVSEVNLSEGTVTIHIGGYCGDYNSEGTYKYAGTKVVSEEIKEFLDYIVSDKENAYPDGGEKGGYWYERVVEGIDLEKLGCTKFEEGTITPASTIQSASYSLSHSLGEIPRYLIVYLPEEDVPSSGSSLQVYIACANPSSAYRDKGHDYYYELGGTASQMYYNSTSSGGYTWTSSKVQVYGGYSCPLKAGLTYNYILLA